MSASFIEWALFEIQWIVNFHRFDFNPLLLAWQIFNSFSPFFPILICYPNHSNVTMYDKQSMEKFFLFYSFCNGLFFSLHFFAFAACIPFIKYYSQFFSRFIVSYEKNSIHRDSSWFVWFFFFSSFHFAPWIFEMHFSCYCIRMYDECWMPNAECLFVCDVLKMFHMFWFHVHVKARKTISALFLGK